MLFIEYPKCSTCKKAKSFLMGLNIEFDDRNIVTETPSVEELMVWKDKFNIPMKRFFNTSGLKYKELGLKDKLSTMPVEKQFELLASDGMLIKRPLLIGDNFILIGFKENEWKVLSEVK